MKVQVLSEVPVSFGSHEPNGGVLQHSPNFLEKVMQSKYTKELLAPIVAANVSIAGVLKALGLHLAGGNYANLKQRISKLEIDTSHFLGKAANQGVNHKGSYRKSPADILVLRSEFEIRIAGLILRRALIEKGRIYKCESVIRNLHGMGNHSF